MSENESDIQRRIFDLRNSINVYLSLGDAEEVNRLRDQIGDLERQLSNQRGQEPASEEHHVSRKS